MKQRFFERNEIYKFFRSTPERVDELFSCGAIKEMPDGIYDKEVFCEAFNREAEIKRPPPPPPEPRLGHIYFFEVDGFVKIGSTSGNPLRRLHACQVGNPKELRLLGYYSVAAECAEEIQLHGRFAASRVRGEWFRDSPELRQLIALKCPANDNPVAPDAKTA